MHRIFFVAATVCWIGSCAPSATSLHAANPPANPTPTPIDARAFLREGLFEEEANRDLGKAAADYAAVVEQYDAGRTVAATAIFRLAEVRAKQGNQAEATALYQRVLAEFPGDDALAKPSRERLAALGALVPGVAKSISSDTRPTPPWMIEEAKSRYERAEAMPRSTLAEIELAKEAYHEVITKIPLDTIYVDLANRRMAELGALKPVSALTAEEAEDLVRVQELVKNSPDLLNATAGAGSPVEGYTSPLTHAAEKGWVQAAAFLLDHGAKPNGPASGGEPLHLAAANGHKALVELLLARGADLNAATPDGWTALHAACEGRRTEIIRLLLDKGANPNVVYSEAKRVPPAENPLLPGWGLATAPEPTANGMTVPRDIFTWDFPVLGTPLLIALFNEDDALLLSLLDHGADPSLAAPLGGNSQYEISPLIYALNHGQTARAKRLLERGAKVGFVGANGVTALHAAARSTPEMASLLLDRGATQVPDGSGKTPLFYAVSSLWNLLPANQTPATVEVPLSPQFQQDFPVRRAAWEALLAHGADINARDHEGKTPLFTCLLPGSKPREMAAFLLDHGADINAPDEWGETPLHQFCNQERLELEQNQPLALGFLAWLVDRGANLEARGTHGKTPFAEVGKTEVQVRLERRFLFPQLIPKFAREHAVTAIVSVLASAPLRVVRVDPAADYDAPPTLAGLLRRALDPNFVPNLTVHVQRAGPDGTVAEAVNLPLHFDPLPTDLSGYPTLRWGDVVTLESDDRASKAQIATNFKSLLARLERQVTLQLGDRTTTLTLADPAADDGALSADWLRLNTKWDPTAKALPDWTLPELVRALASGEPRARLDAVRIERPGVGQPQSWTVDLRAAVGTDPDPVAKRSPTGPEWARAYLASGDRLVIPLQPVDDPAALEARRRTICLTAPGRYFTERVFALENDPVGTHTLGELIMQAYLDPMIVRYPDFSKVTIHRLKADGGEDHLPFDLLKVIRTLGEQAGEQDARRADPTLQWGDTVEIAPVGGFTSDPWTQFNPETRDFLYKALARDTDTTVNGQKLVGNSPAGTPWRTQLLPLFTGYRSSANNRLFADGGSRGEQAPFTARGLLGRLLINPANVVRFSVQVGGQTRDYDAAEVERINPWLDLGSKVSIRSVAP